MPMRWPRPHGMSVSSARTPSGSCVSIMRRVSGCGAAWSTRRRAGRGAATDRRRSGGRGRRARGRAAPGRPGSTSAPSAACGAVAGAHAAQVAERHAHQLVVAHRDDLGDDRADVGRARATELPIGSCSPTISRLSPSTRATRPGHVRAGGVEHGVEERGHERSPGSVRRAPRGRGRARRRCGRRCGSRRRRRRSRRGAGSGRRRRRATRPGARSAGSPSAARSSGWRRAITWPCSGANASARAIASRPGLLGVRELVADEHLRDLERDRDDLVLDVDAGGGFAGVRARRPRRPSCGTRPMSRSARSAVRAAPRRCRRRSRRCSRLRSRRA